MKLVMKLAVKLSVPTVCPDKAGEGREVAGIGTSIRQVGRNRVECNLCPMNLLQSDDFNDIPVVQTQCGFLVASRSLEIRCERFHGQPDDNLYVSSVWSDDRRRPPVPVGHPLSSNPPADTVTTPRRPGCRSSSPQQSVDWGTSRG